jgi:hypothetical protein
MPDALIVADSDFKDKKIVDEMVRIGLIKMVSVKGVRVYGRPYLTNRAIRLAYYKKIGLPYERERDNPSRKGPVKEKLKKNGPQRKERA